jgi:hypothetical protein
MTKKKTTPSSRAGKVLEFPPRVLEVKELLRKKKSKFFPTMKKLTESEDLHREESLKKMWISLEKANQKEQEASRESPNNIFIEYFVGLTSGYAKLPAYCYQTVSRRKQTIKEIKKLTGQLAKILQHNQLDHRLAYSDQRNGLYFYERLGFIENQKANLMKTEMPRISEMLGRLAESVEKDLKSEKNRRSDKHTCARRFVRCMGAYLKSAYGTPMNSVLIAATAAMFDIEYDESDIRKILKR